MFSRRRRRARRRPAATPIMFSYVLVDRLMTALKDARWNVSKGAAARVKDADVLEKLEKEAGRAKDADVLSTLAKLKAAARKHENN